jgi:phospholipase/carboxylesterase
LVVMLHGAGSSSADVSLLPVDTNAAGVLLLVPDSRGSSWDIVGGTFGPDVVFIDAALRQTFSSCAVRTDQIGLFGFSDGASYALSLGLANGDLFNHIAAFAPGFFAPPGQVGKPRVFLAHATDDPVLPVAFSRSLLAPQLTQLGYDVTYLEVRGGHAVNQEERTASLEWFLA